MVENITFLIILVIISFKFIEVDIILYMTYVISNTIIIKIENNMSHLKVKVNG